MKTIKFNTMKTGKGRQDAVSSGACLVEFKGSGGREVQDTCLLLNVTGLSDEAIDELADSVLLMVSIVKDKSING